jgi:hypothetical protein
MKNTKRLLLAAAFFLATQGLHAQVATADSLVHRMFTTLQTKDEKSFVALYPNAEQFTRFMKVIMEKVLNSDAIKQVMALDEKTKNLNIDSLIMAEVTKSSSPEEFAKMQEKFGKTFRDIIEKGEKKGVKWSEARLTNFTIDSTTAVDKEAEQLGLTGLKEAKGVIDFSVGEDAYQLAFSKMVYLQSEGGWFGAEFPQLARKGESLAPDKSADEDSPPPMERIEQKKTTGTKGKAPAAKKPGAAKAPVRKKA